MTTVAVCAALACIIIMLANARSMWEYQGARSVPTKCAKCPLYKEAQSRTVCLVQTTDTRTLTTPRTT